MATVVAFSAITQLVTTGINVWVSSHARQENCDNTHESLQGAFQLLGERLDADQAEIDDFLQELEPITKDCS